MNHMICLDGRQVEVIAYFRFDSTRNHYLIYCSPENTTTIYLSSVVEKDGVFELNAIEKTQSFLFKKFIKELIEKDLSTVKCYRYFNKLAELQDNFNYHGSQEIVLNSEKKTMLQEFITEINAHNGEILEKANEEYYLQLVDEKRKERITIIILLIILFAALGLIAKMIIDFM